VTNLNVLKLKPTPYDASVPGRYALEVDSATNGTVVFYVDATGVIGGVDRNGFVGAVVRSLTLPLPSFIITNNSIGGQSSQISNTTAAFLATNSAPAATVANSMPTIQWNGYALQASPISVLFRIPADYATGGTIVLMCTQSVTGQQISFDMWNRQQYPGTTPATTASLQATYMIVGTNTSSISTVILTPINALISAAAGDWLTVRIWRDSGMPPPQAGYLNLHGVTFTYQATR
jgi:hypothetical protein